MSKNFDKGRNVDAYRAIAEQALGHPLPAAAVVHHIDEDWRNNRNDNLVICENESYHRLLHVRLRAFRASGHANWLRCCICKQYGPPTEIKRNNANGSHYHPKCAANYVKHRLRRVRLAKREQRKDGRGGT